MLISSCNNFSTMDFNPGNELPYVIYLPTYAADAWYHGKLDADSLVQLRQDAEAWFAR